MSEWIVRAEGYNQKEYLHKAPVNTVGNGYFCCRGFLEEEQQGLQALGGAYMAGVFGKAPYKPWKGSGAELVNLPNFFWTKISINGEPLVLDEKNMQGFVTELDLATATFTHSYTYTEDRPLVMFSFTRFVSHADLHTAGQQIFITPLEDNLDITLEYGVNWDITNLNAVSCEPWPVQPGRKHWELESDCQNKTIVLLREPEEIKLGIANKFSLNGQEQSDGKFNIKLAAGQKACVERVLAVASTVFDGGKVEENLESRLTNLPRYEKAFSDHKDAVAAFWDNADIQLAGNSRDQLALRYNMLQLHQSCPRHTGRYSIGARGLTGEMYEGCVFWDTEIFMLPFFLFSDPHAAKRLLEFRYNTLDEARCHAKSNWFEGAMYGWQVNAEGIEQTPHGVGAYYSIHVIADIAYAIQQYWLCTGDKEFMLEKGLEILIETARFWVSRVTLREDGLYDIMAVRGPNEYDVLVNNNLYTNMMARENFSLCTQLLEELAAFNSAAIQSVKEKLGFSATEIETWGKISENIVLPYDWENDLWLEDDTYYRRKPLDMADAKPTAKRIIDTTIPYEALSFYQVSKQADVLHLMKNLPWHFTQEQVRKAYDYYKPKTAFDSSLAYSMFSLMAAQLGHMNDATEYYDLCANLDLYNVQLNTISGLHFANFGGTWQAVVFGFAGVTIDSCGIHVNPHLPESWASLSFKVCYHNAQIQLDISHDCLKATYIKGESAVPVHGFGKKHVLDFQQPEITVDYNEFQK